MEETSTQERTIKIVFQDEIRKYRDINSYKDLILSIARTMGYGVLNCRFVYVDDDGDEITVSNEEDLAEAYNFFGDRVPKLKLVPYDEKPDLSLSEIKLCDSVAEEKAPFCELIDQESDSEPAQNLGKSTCERPVPEESFEKSKDFEVVKDEQIEVVVEKSVVQPPISDENSKANFSPVENCASQEESEDRIQPAFKREDRITPAYKREDRILKVERESSNQEPKTEENEFRIKAADKNLVDFQNLKSRVAEIAKEQLNVLLPKILEECKTYMNSQPQKPSPAPVASHPEQKGEGKKLKQAVHKNIMCDSCTCLPIRGVRFQCIICDDFDLCAQCEGKNKHKHPMLKIDSSEKYDKFIKELTKKGSK